MTTSKKKKNISFTLMNKDSKALNKKYPLINLSRISRVYSRSTMVLFMKYNGIVSMYRNTINVQLKIENSMKAVTILN